MRTNRKRKPIEARTSKINGIKVRGSDGSDYVLSLTDIAMNKATKQTNDPANAKRVLAGKIIPDFLKNPEKAREWAKRMDPSEMNFIKVRHADTPSNEELAEGLSKGQMD